METTVFLIRHGVTAWHDEKRLLGQRDIELNEEGLAQADAIADALADLNISEVITSPLTRAVQTATKLAERYQTQVTRDPRLIDFGVGRWEGLSYQAVAASPEYQRFLQDPLSAGIPGGETLLGVRDRAVAAIEQILQDTPAGDPVALISHAGVVRVLLAHYLGSNLANYHRLRVAPGSVSVLSFADGRELPRVLVTNWLPRIRNSLGWTARAGQATAARVAQDARLPP